MSRHSFATTIALSNGVPIETVSKMLGHKSIKTTQIYAKITDMKKLGISAVLASVVIVLMTGCVGVTGIADRVAGW